MVLSDEAPSRKQEQSEHNDRKQSQWEREPDPGENSVPGQKRPSAQGVAKSIPTFGYEGQPKPKRHRYPGDDETEQGGEYPAADCSQEGFAGWSHIQKVPLLSSAGKGLDGRYLRSSLVPRYTSERVGQGLSTCRALKTRIIGTRNRGLGLLGQALALDQSRFANRLSRVMEPVRILGQSRDIYGSEILRSVLCRIAQRFQATLWCVYDDQLLVGAHAQCMGRFLMVHPGLEIGHLDLKHDCRRAFHPHQEQNPSEGGRAYFY